MAEAGARSGLDPLAMAGLLVASAIVALMLLAGIGQAIFDDQAPDANIMMLLVALAGILVAGWRLLKRKAP